MGDLLLEHGANYVATGVSQYLGSVVANFARMPSNDLDSLQSLPLYFYILYTKLFFGLGWLAAGGTAVAIVLLLLLNRLSREHRRCVDAVRSGTDPFAPAKPASLQ